MLFTAQVCTCTYTTITYNTQHMHACECTALRTRTHNNKCRFHMRNVCRNMKIARKLRFSDCLCRSRIATRISLCNCEPSNEHSRSKYTYIHTYRVHCTSNMILFLTVRELNLEQYYITVNIIY